MPLLLFTATALGQQPPHTIPFDQARRDADRILAQPEFRAVSEPSLFDRILAKIVEWIVNLIDSLARVGGKSPWIATTIEWTVFALAAAALLAWGFRAMQRQRLQMLLENAAAPHLALGETNANAWAELARSQANNQAWRDAVHSLYWATIVTLEDRHLWRPNRARTPREYLRLLEPNSPRQQSLGGLTRIFERIWYGNRPAAQSDYDRALAHFNELSRL